MSPRRGSQSVELEWSEVNVLQQARGWAAAADARDDALESRAESPGNPDRRIAYLHARQAENEARENMLEAIRRAYGRSRQ